MVAQQTGLWREQEVENLIEQALQIERGAAGGTGDQVVQPLPAEDLAVEQHFPQAVAQLGVGILHQPAGEVGVGGAEDLELGINAQGDALERHQRTDDQGVVGGHPEREAIHHAREVVGDCLEVHAADPHLQGLAEHALERWHDRFEIDVLR